MAKKTAEETALREKADRYREKYEFCLMEQEKKRKIRKKKAAAKKSAEKKGTRKSANTSKTKKDESGAPPYSLANSRLKRAVYGMVRKHIASDKMDLLKRVATSDQGELHPSQENQENPFYWGLFLLCGLDGLTKSSRSRFAQELLYAHRHDVPKEHLIGFIYQIGSSKGLGKKLQDGKMEPWYKAKEDDQV